MSPTAPRNRKLSQAIRLKVGGYLTRSSRYVLFMDDEGEIMLTKDYPWTDQDRREIKEARTELLKGGLLQAVVHVGVVVEEPFLKLSFVEIFDDPDQPTIHVLVTSRDHKSYWVSMDEAIIDQWLSYWEEEKGEK